MKILLKVGLLVTFASAFVASEKVAKNEKLLFSVQIARHCERAPDNIFDLAINAVEDDFTEAFKCTITGADHHHKNGKEMRAFSDSKDNFLANDYNPR